MRVSLKDDAVSGSPSTVTGILYSHSCYRYVLYMITSNVHAAFLIKAHTLQLFIIWGGAHVELSEQSLQEIVISKFFEIWNPLTNLEPLTKVCIVTVADVGLHHDE